MDTHLHADPISGGRKLAEKVGGTYWLPPKDAEEVVFYEPLVEGSVITVGVLKLKLTHYTLQGIRLVVHHLS